MINWDWAEGYFSAVRFIASVPKPPITGSSNAAAWISAGGTVVAAGAAAYAALLSRRAAQQSMLVTLEAERSALVQDALRTKHNCENQASLISAALISMTSTLLPNDKPTIQKLWERKLDSSLASYKKRIDDCTAIVDRTLIAREPVDISKTKKDLVFLQSKIRDLDAILHEIKCGAAEARVFLKL